MAQDGAAPAASPAAESAPGPAGSTSAPAGSDGTTAAPDDGIGGGSFLWLLLLWGAVLYLFFMRPQRKKEKERKAKIEQVKKGDDIVTIGGIHGTITKVEEDAITVQVDAKNGITMKFARAAVNTVTNDKTDDAA